jgi:hypothetical protein
VRSRLLTTTVLAGMAGAIWSQTSKVILRFNVKRGPSLRCWIFGHEDWVRRAPGRLYLECLDCGRETPGWTTSGNQPDDGATGASVEAIGNRPDRCGSDVIPSAVGRSGRPERPAASVDNDEIPIAA